MTSQTSEDPRHRTKTIRTGDASCSWGVEFADDPRNPSWRRVLRDCARAGCTDIELGPVDFMPKDPAMLADSLAANGLELIGSISYRRAPTVGRADEAAQMGNTEWTPIATASPKARVSEPRNTG